MKISGNKLSKAMSDSGLTAEQLATTLVEKGFSADDAASAIRNWMRNNDHPRCKAKQVAKLAQSLGVNLADIVVFQSMINGHRGSPRKARLLADLIRGKRAEEALNLLAFNTKRAAVNIRKCLSAAVADAGQAELDLTDLVVCESRVDEGTRIKRFQPKDRGRAHPIIKPLSHIIVSVERTGKRG